LYTFFIHCQEFIVVNKEKNVVYMNVCKRT